MFSLSHQPSLFSRLTAVFGMALVVLLNVLAVGSYRNTTLREYFDDQNAMYRPMMSLRDVDEGGIIRKGSSDPNPRGKHRLDAASVIAVMDTIRYGTAVGGEKE